MCVYSNVMDHYQPLFPVPVEPVKPFAPGVSPLPWSPPVDVEELKKLIADFKEAMAAAKKVDEKVGHPDCADPEKEKLVARVAELEARLAAYEPAAVASRARLVEAFKKAGEALDPLSAEDQQRVLSALTHIFGAS